MPQTFIVKFMPDDMSGCVIHKIQMPQFGERNGYSREISKWNGFAHGMRKGSIPKEHRDTYKAKCNHAPTGTYYCLDFQEEYWIKKCEFAREFQVEIGHPERQDKVDERLYPCVEHDSIDDFFFYIGFDRKTRRYV